jgi:ATP-dependent helicase/DNAse subunit B
MGHMSNQGQSTADFNDRQKQVYAIYKKFQIPPNQHKMNAHPFVKLIKLILLIRNFSNNNFFSLNLEND